MQSPRYFAGLLGFEQIGTPTVGHRLLNLCDCDSVLSERWVGQLETVASAYRPPKPNLDGLGALTAELLAFLCWHKMLLDNGKNSFRCPRQPTAPKTV